MEQHTIKIIIFLLGGYIVILKSSLENYKREIKELKKIIYEIRDDVLILKERNKDE